MGALVRATREELARLEQDGEWWPGVLARVSDEGIAALPEIVETHVWAFGGFRQWVASSEEREGQWQEALRHYAEKMVLESVGIADAATVETVGVAKLRGDRRMQVAGKLDRDRWGERTRVDGGAVLLVDAGLIGFAGALLDRLAAPKERVIEAEAQIADEI